MRVADFSFDLPDELIARFPKADRTSSRLLTLDGPSGTLEHKVFSDILDLVNEGDLLVFNNTRVIPARMFGQKASGGKVEVLVERVLDEHRVLAHVRASKSLKVGNEVILEGKAKAIMVARHDTLFELEFDHSQNVLDILNDIGHMPLPPYIDRPDTDADRERYQTVYGEKPGAVAAPTAGLHFSKQLMKRMEIKGVDMAYITLHIGLGTFREVEVEDITKHKVDSEQLIIEDSCVERVNRAKAEGRRICAIGSTSMRAMENSVSTTNTLKPYKGWTNKFIFPKYDFRVADSLLTNFHTQQSTLLMLQSAFAGHELIMEAYNEAIKEGYRFYAYGDALLIK